MCSFIENVPLFLALRLLEEGIGIVIINEIYSKQSKKVCAEYSEHIFLNFYYSMEDSEQFS